MKMLKLDTSAVESNAGWKGILAEAELARGVLIDGTGPGAAMRGWRTLPLRIGPSSLSPIRDLAQEVRQEAEALVVVGIGGSYLGARAAIDFLGPAFANERPSKQRRGPAVYFAGHHLGGAYLADLLDTLRGKTVYCNVISKSGTTTEPGVAFRILRAFIEKEAGSRKAAQRIIATTGKGPGGLRALAEERGYRTLSIPEDIGGRYSVLTPVGLFPIASAGGDLESLLAGAASMADILEAKKGGENPAVRYAAARNLLNRRGKSIEILAAWEPALQTFGKWWEQLAGESEGKAGKGIFPAAIDFTTDLHSLGQWIQEGPRLLFETFLSVSEPGRDLRVPATGDDTDRLAYLEGVALQAINDKAAEGTREAHTAGGVPVLSVRIPDPGPFSLGAAFYFFEYAVAVSGYLLGVNPFDQPGVEAYKKNMFRLLGKPEG